MAKVSAIFTQCCLSSTLIFCAFDCILPSCHQASARGVMSLLTSSVVHQVAIAPTASGKSAANEPNSKASAAARAAAVPKTRSAALRAVAPDE